jgi:hypothetical protein
MKNNKRLITFFALVLCVPSLAIAVLAACAAGKTYIEQYVNCFTYSNENDRFRKIAIFTLNTVQGSVNKGTWGMVRAASKHGIITLNSVTRCSTLNYGTTRVSM